MPKRRKFSFQSFSYLSGDMRGSGIRRNSVNKKSPRRKTIQNRWTFSDLRALNELSEAADSLAYWGLTDIPSNESDPEEGQGMGDITVAHDDNNQQRHSVEGLADEFESLGRQLLLQGNSHIPRPFVNVDKDYMNHSARGYNEFDNSESELTKHKSGIKDRVSEFVQVKYAYAHTGLPFEHSWQGKVRFRDLDYPLLVEGELGIIWEQSLQVSDGELVGGGGGGGGGVIAIAKKLPTSKGLRMACAERLLRRRPVKDRKGDDNMGSVRPGVLGINNYVKGSVAGR